MKKNTTPEKGCGPLAWIMVFVAVVAALIIFVPESGQEDRKSTAAAPTMAAGEPIYEGWPESEIHAFWDRYIDPIVRQQLPAGTYPIPEIQEEYTKLATRVIEATGRPLQLQASVRYDDLAPSALAGVRDATVIFFVPSFMDLHEELAASGDPDWEEQFQSRVAASFVHEVQHLGYGFSSPSGGKIDPRELVSHETGAWDMTCKKVVAPLVHHGRAIDQSLATMCQAWSICGEAPNQCFAEFIGRLYEPVTQ